MEHIKQEVLNTLNFLFYVYNLFGFKYELFLSTRPKKFIGQISTWNLAEQHLKDALYAANVQWKINEGDGAFYGPKIDILVKDSLNRTHQCGTIQLDFQLPVRFNLQYKNKEYVTNNEKNEKNEKNHDNDDNVHNNNNYPINHDDRSLSIWGAKKYKGCCVKANNNSVAILLLMLLIPHLVTVHFSSNVL